MAQRPKVSLSVVSLHRPPFFNSISGLTAAGGQDRNQLAQVRFVADEEDSLRFFVVDFRDQLEGVTVGLEEFAECDFLVEFIGYDFCSLFGACKRAGENEIELQLHAEDRFRDLLRFVLPSGVRGRSPSFL